MTLCNDISWILAQAQMRINDMDPNDASRSNAQGVMDSIVDALSDIQTDNDGQFVIYTGLKDPKWIDWDDDEEKIGAHVFKGNSVAVTCSLCGNGFAHKSHA